MKGEELKRIIEDAEAKIKNVATQLNLTVEEFKQSIKVFVTPLRILLLLGSSCLPI